MGIELLPAQRKTALAYGLQDQQTDIPADCRLLFQQDSHPRMAGRRAGGIREGALQLAVNSRTVLKAYEYLQTEDIIYPERGMGFYLSKDAVKKVMRIQKKEFFDNQLADMFRSMELLGISIEEITERYNKLKKDGS
jgi:GntR family transcriptional regulator